MARRYNSKETIKHIQDTAEELFIEKGFEKTSLQDIIDISGISKGAIFHHFKSKEDIFSSVIDKHYNYIAQKMNEELNTKVQELTGKEKLSALIESYLTDIDNFTLSKLVATEITSPHIIVTTIQNDAKKLAPLISAVITQGIEDNSLQVKFPEESAQAIVLLFTVWCDPIIFQCNIETIRKRFEFFQYLMKQLGMDIVKDTMIDNAVNLIEILYKERI